MKLLIWFLLLMPALNSLAQTPEEKLIKLGIQLPEIGTPVAGYVHLVKVGNLIFLSGKGPLNKDGKYITGKLGNDLSVEQGYEAAKLTAIIQIAVLKKYLGDLSKIKRIVKVNGFVNNESNFYNQPKVINGFSDLMTQIFGENGQHARTAIGVSALPFNMAVEVEMIVEVE